jgi:membrane associated rhomboid family serine protease
MSFSQQQSSGNWGGPPSPRVPMRLWSATRWIIAINIAVFLLDLIFGGRLSEAGNLGYAATIMHLQLWRPITYQFLHFGALHIFFNLIVLYYFGPLIEPILGRLRFAIFYLCCGVAGALVFLIFSKLHWIGLSPSARLVGASASIFGVMGAAARLMPNTRVQMVLFFIPPIQMRMLNLVLIYAGMALLVLLTAGQNAGGELSHLGGALLGYGIAGSFSRLSRVGSSQKKSAFWQPGQNNFLREEFRK